jgi:hypothetical protein
MYIFYSQQEASMKQLAKLFFAFLVSISLLSTAYASTGYYGSPKKLFTAKSHMAGGNNGQVVLYNYTSDSYMAYATFKDSNAPLNLALGPAHSGTDIITYDINFPDYAVCIQVVRDFDNAVVYNDCLSDGNIFIGPYAVGSKKPTVRVTK